MRTPAYLVLSLSLLPLLPLANPGPLIAAPLDVMAVERSTGAKGDWIDAEKVYRIRFPRDAVSDSTNGSWASFKSGNQFPAILMGRVVLRASDVDAAVSAAVENGIEVTALYAQPAGEGGDAGVYVMHIGGEGTAEQLGAGVKRVFDAAKAAAAGSASPPRSAITAKPLDAILGQAGETANDGTYRLVIGREVSMPCACKAAAAMGMNTSATFSGSDGNATLTGQFACTYAELQPVLRSLRSQGLSVTAVTNHQAAEAPRLIFAHFRGSGRAADLAKAVRATLDAQKNRPAAAHEGHGGHGHHKH